MSELSPLFQHITDVAKVLSEQIGEVNSNLAVIDDKIEYVTSEQRATRDRVEEVYGELREFVVRDRKEKAWQRAVSELNRVRAELQKSFGHHDELRHHAVGILQATDLAIVRQETILTRAEELLLGTSGYWLAPTLVALSAWIKDDRPLAEKAMTGAIQRDDNKTSFFFALICRRSRRTEATTLWLSRYFEMQNPFALDREVVVMLNGLANGVFGEGALTTCSNVIENWIAELEEQAGFLEEQRSRWCGKLGAMAPRIGDHEYPQLRTHSPKASELLTSLTAARRNQIIYDFFNDLFVGEVVVPASLAAEVDGELYNLVKNYDNKELPLRREERLNELIREEQGDEAMARQRYAAEAEVFVEQTNFGAMLTNAAVNPEQSGATRATQRYAVSRSRQWIMPAYSDLVLADRRQIPRDIEIKAGSWSGSSVDGSNQRQLQADLRQHYTARIEAAVAAVRLSPGPWIALVAGALLGLVIMFSGGVGAFLTGLVIACAAGAFFFWKFKDLDNVRARAREDLSREAAEAERILLACLAELADCRREISAEDAKSVRVVELLESLSAPQFVLRRSAAARAVGEDPSARPSEGTPSSSFATWPTPETDQALARGLPSWDLVPADTQVVRRKFKR